MKIHDMNLVCVYFLNIDLHIYFLICQIKSLMKLKSQHEPY